MWELRPTIEPDKRATENSEINENFTPLLIAGSLCGSNPIALDRAVGKDAGVEISRFAGLAIEPEASSEFHG